MELKEGAQRKSYVRRMFNSIAAKYDLLNHLLSIGIDVYWRKRAVKKLNIADGSRILDLACGTGDLALEALKQKRCRVVGLDIAYNMLRFGQRKRDNRKRQLNLRFVNGDGEQLPFPDAVFGGAMIAFGIRNMGHIEDALREVRRVLRSGAPFVLLEFSLPTFRPFRWLYLFYFNYILPVVGRLISRDKEAYNYLPASVGDFPPIFEFTDQLRNTGLQNIQYWKLLNGVAVIYRGYK